MDVPALGGADPKVVSLRAAEELGQLPTWHVELFVHDGVSRSQLEATLDGGASLMWEDGGEEQRVVYGMVSELRCHHVEAEGSWRVAFSLVPRLWGLTQRFGNEVFVGCSVPEVVAKKAAAVGLEEGRDVVFRLADAYEARDLVVQYEETDLAFVSRLCEHEGITWFVEHRDGKDVVVFTDSTAQFATASALPHLPVTSQREHPSVFDVEVSLRRQPRAAEVHDYDYRAPRLELLGKADHERLAATHDWVEYGAATRTPAASARMARVRAERWGARAETITGRCTHVGIRPGEVIALDHFHEGGAEDGRLLVTSVTQRMDNRDDALGWELSFEAIPAAVAFRPPRDTPRPRIAGLINARIDGEVKGHYAEIDAMGRYHLQLGFDRSGRTDRKASHPVRMMQPHAGSHYGMHFPLQPGTEVLVAFVDGNPDRPIIVGTAPNPETWSPVDADNYTQNVLRTKSSNELVIEDQLEHERIRLHTPHRATTFQLGSIEEPEVGALLRTEGHVSQASRGAHTVASSKQTLMTGQQVSLAGGDTVLLAGVEGVTRSVARGLEQPDGVDVGGIASSLSALARGPEAEGDGESDEEAVHGGAVGGGLWSALADSVAEGARGAAREAARRVAEQADATLDDSVGRRQGDRSSPSNGASFVAATSGDGSMISGATATVFGAVSATLSSNHTAKVTGALQVEIKSPTAVEIAGREELALTSAREITVESQTHRLVAGYYPEAMAPKLDENTSLGILSRKDLRVTSAEDCILLCAGKNIVASAHDGDVRISAHKTISLVSETTEWLIVDHFNVAATTITLASSGDIVIDSGGGAISIKAADITLDGDATVTGDLKVDGSLTVASTSSL